MPWGRQMPPSLPRQEAGLPNPRPEGRYFPFYLLIIQTKRLNLKFSFKACTHPASPSAAALKFLTLGLTLGNGGGVDFQASQCIPMDPDAWVDAAADADARCVYARSVSQAEEILGRKSLSEFSNILPTNKW